MGALGAGACTSHHGRVVRYPASPESAKQEAKARRRAMTWAEYYTDITERARRRGTMVVWITPPTPRKPRVELSSK